MSNIEIKKNYNKNNTIVSQHSKNDTKEDDILLLLPEYLPPLTRTCGIYQSCNGKEPCGSTRCYLLTIKKYIKNT